MILETIAVALALFATHFFLNIAWKHWIFSPIPGPVRDGFLYGNIKQFRRSLSEKGSIAKFYLELTQQYGTVFHFWLGSKPVVVISDPPLVKDFITETAGFKRGPLAGRDTSLLHTLRLNKTVISTERIGKVNLMGAESILTAETGPKWKRKRRLMGPAFTLKSLSTYLPRFYDIAERLAEAVEKELISNGAEQIVDMAKVGAPFTIDAISLAGFNASPEELEILRGMGGGVRDILTTSRTQGNDWISVMRNAKLRKTLQDSETKVQEIRDTGRDMIMKRIGNGTYGSFHDVLDYVIASNTSEETGNIEMEETLDDFLTMYVAGNATTHTSMGFLLCEAVRNPEVMEKLVAEVDSVWSEACISSNSSASEIAETLKNMTYLDLVVKETMRIHPPVQVTERTTTSRLQLNGYHVPNGTTVHASQYVMHNFDKYWDEPEKFRPERFESAPQPYTYYPFLFGPRQCIGKNFAILELKCFICELLKRFEVEKDPAAPDGIPCAQAVLCYPTYTRHVMRFR